MDGDSVPAAFLKGGAAGNANAALLASIAGNTLARTGKKGGAPLLPPLIDQVNPAAAHALNLIWSGGLDCSTVQRIQVEALKNVAQAWKQQNEQAASAAPKIEPAAEPAAFDMDELRKRLARQAEAEATGSLQPGTSPAAHLDLSALLGLSSTLPSAFGAASAEGTVFASASQAVKVGPKRVKTGLKVGGFVCRDISDAEIARIEALVGHVAPASSSNSKPPDSILAALMSVNEIMATGKDEDPTGFAKAAAPSTASAKPKGPACAAGVAAQVAAAAAAAAAKAAAVARLAPAPAPTKLPPSLRASEPPRPSKPGRGGELLEDYRPEDWRMPQDRGSASPQRADDLVDQSELGRDEGQSSLIGGGVRDDEPPLRRIPRRDEDESRDDREWPPLDPFLNTVEREKAALARQLESGKSGGGARDRGAGRKGGHDDLWLPGQDDRHARKKGDTTASASDASRRFNERGDRGGVAPTRDTDRRHNRNRNADRGAEARGDQARAQARAEARAAGQRKREARSNSSSSSSSNKEPSAKKPTRRSIFSSEPGTGHAAPVINVKPSRKIIFVSSKAAQLIIGKNGDTVHEIQRMAGCNIQVRRETKGAPLCEISLSGNYIGAEELMEKVLHQHGLTLQGPVEPYYG